MKSQLKPSTNNTIAARFVDFLMKFLVLTQKLKTLSVLSSNSVSCFAFYSNNLKSFFN